MIFEDFCQHNNIVIQYCNLTTKVKGLCMKLDDYYVVILNSRFSYESQRRTLEHEVIHVMENHFSYDCSSVNVCEEEVHRLIKEMKYHYEQSEEYYFDF